MDPIAIEKTYVTLADPPKGSANQRLPDAFADAYLRYLGRCRSTLGHVETRKPLVETALQKIPEPSMRTLAQVHGVFQTISTSAEARSWSNPPEQSSSEDRARPLPPIRLCPRPF